MATVNHIVAALSRSPLGGRLRSRVCLLRYETGQPAHRITTPVQYATNGAVVVIVAADAAGRTSWRHVRAPRDAELHLAGRWTGVSLHVASAADAEAHVTADEVRFRRPVDAGDVVVIATRD